MVGALEMAIAQRRPDDVIHHSDLGSQYTSLAFGKRCRDAGVGLSMGSVGDCYDNAMAESFFASPECELLDRTTFRDRAEAKTELFRWIEARRSVGPAAAFVDGAPRWGTAHRASSATAPKSVTENLERTACRTMAVKPLRIS